MNIHQLLQIEYPLFQGGMAQVATGAFAAVASNAGALGIIGSGGMTADQLDGEIERCRALTDRPFGVNIILLHPEAAQMALICAERKVPVVTTGAGSPGGYIPLWKRAGCKVFPVVPSVSLALRMQRAGADGVIAEGTESGGHVGETTTMALLPQVADAVSIPVLAAGGVGNGRQLLAAEALGASGAQLGTCLLVSQECPIHENYKLALIKSKDTDTTVTGRAAGAPVRILKNQMARRYLKLEKDGADRMELEHITLGALRRAVLEGDTVNGSMMAGQIAGQLRGIRPLGDILKDIMDEYRRARAGLLNNGEFSL